MTTQELSHMAELHAADDLGWLEDENEPFNDTVGPLSFQITPTGNVLCRMDAGLRHTNGLGILHGGCLLTLADYCLFHTGAQSAGHHNVVTLSLNAEFISAGAAGEPVYARGVITRGGRSIVFSTGELFQRTRLLMTFSGVSKVLREAPS